MQRHSHWVLTCYWWQPFGCRWLAKRIAVLHCKWLVTGEFSLELRDIGVRCYLQLLHA